MSKPLSAITPIVLTYNEAANVGRTLRSLEWALRAVVVDSGSTDATERIVRRYPNANWFVRPFESHQMQWRFAIEQTRITSDYILALDADMLVPPAFVAEITTSEFMVRGFHGGRVGFRYHVNGRPLLGSLCPPQIRIFRRGSVTIQQPGHTQTFSVAGPVYSFRSKLIHDDRKSFERWVLSQLNYSRLEARRIAGESRPRLRDWLRRAGVMPPIVWLLSYLRAGGPLVGAAARHYAYERLIYEALLATQLTTRGTNEQSECASDPKGHLGRRE